MRADTAVRTYSRKHLHANGRARRAVGEGSAIATCARVRKKFLTADGGDDHQKQDGQQPTQNVPHAHAYVFSPAHPPLLSVFSD